MGGHRFSQRAKTTKNEYRCPICGNRLNGNSSHNSIKPSKLVIVNLITTGNQTHQGLLLACEACSKQPEAFAQLDRKWFVFKDSELVGGDVWGLCPSVAPGENPGPTFSRWLDVQRVEYFTTLD